VIDSDEAVARRFVCGPRRAPLRHFCVSRIGGAALTLGTIASRDASAADLLAAR